MPDGKPARGRKLDQSRGNNILIDIQPYEFATTDVDLDSETVPVPANLVDPDRIKAACKLWLAHLYEQLGLFLAMERAWTLVEEDELRLGFTGDGSNALNALYSWPEITRILDRDRLHLVEARTLGLCHPDVPGSECNQLIRPLIARLITALSRFHDGHKGDEHRTARLLELSSLLQAVLMNFTENTSDGAGMVARHQWGNVTTAINTLTQLAKHLCLPGYLNAGSGAYGAVIALRREGLKRAGKDPYQEIRLLLAWQTFLDWVAADHGPVLTPGEVTNEVREAAAILRPEPRDTPALPPR